MKVQEISIHDYHYDLPDERIARYPLPERDASKLLVYRDGQIAEDTYANIGQYLDPGALMVFNNTRVIPARLLFAKPTGGVVEVFCLEPEGELTTAMFQTGEAVWHCLVGGAKKWRSQPLVLEMQHGTHAIRLEATRLDHHPDGQRIRFRWDPPALPFSEVLAAAGQVPLPPYLQRNAEAADRDRYQTIYARHEGSVAAPTAGLHFTDRVFERLAARGISREFVTLHVGAGTFLPVKADTMAGHVMHSEYIDVAASLVRRLREHSGRQLVVVGTTSLRTVESLYLMGAGLLLRNDPPDAIPDVHQWDAYDPRLASISTDAALDALLHWMAHRGTDRIVARTQLLIAPGCRVRLADAVVTNFHQPSSTLLLLVAALVGDDWRRIYDYALAHDFRFLSYGDGSLLFTRP